MRKLILAVGAAAASAVVAGLGLGLGSGFGHADNNSTFNVVGEPYAKAVAILKAQGVHAVFGGSVGSDVPQSQCIVKSEKVLSTRGRIQLDLDCTAAAQPQQPATTAGPSTGGTSGASATESAARPTPGAPGIVTVIPTRVG